MNHIKLADPDEREASDVVIYDGKCNFCLGQVERLARLDWGNRLSFISLHDARVASRYPALTYDQMMEQMYVVSQGGGQFGGSEAVKYLSRRLPLLWLAMPILHLPGTARIWRWMYQQVAKRRYKIAGKNCDGDTCKVHL